MKRIAKNLYQHENGTFYTLHRVGDRQHKKSLGTKDKSLAKQILRQSILRAPNPRNAAYEVATLESKHLDLTAIERPAFSTAVELHDGNTAFGSKDTARNLRLRKRTTLRFCKSWEEFQPVSIWKQYNAEGEALKTKQDLQGGWVSSPNQLRWYLRSLSKFCLERDWVSEAQVNGKIPRKVVPPRRVQIPAPKDVRDLLLMCEAESFELGQFIRWLALSGLRLSGAAGIRWEEINFSAGEYRRKMKGGCEVVIPLLPDALSLLVNRWTSAGKPRAGLVFEMGDYRIKRVRRLLRKYAVGLGIGLTYPHALRHHFASVAFANGFSAGEVAQMLGHKDGGALALQVYGHVIPSQLKTKVAQLRILE
jgi:integrase